MSIASEITRLQTAKANIKTSIENKGVVVSSSDKLDDYSSLIDSINISTQVKTVNSQNYTREITPDVGYRGLSKVVLDGVLVDAHDSYTSTTDDNVAYEKIVPSGALKYASLDKLGGMSYKSENLLNISDVAETTKNGITYKIENGIITLGGTATSNLRIYIPIQPITSGTYSYNQFSKNVGHNVYLSDDISATNTQLILTNSTTTPSATSITISNTMNYLYIYIGSGNVITNYSFKPMLIRGTTAPTEYQPYFEGIRDSAVVSVKSYGSNLLNISDIAETTTNGITYKVENGVITLNGTCSANFEITLTSNMSFNGNYYFSAFNSGYDKGTANLNNRIIFGSEYWNISSNDFGRTITMTNIYGVVKLAIISGNVYTNGVIKPMLVKGSTAPTTYHPYRGLIETKTIPSEVQALDGYGCGVNDTCYNYIDYESKKFIQKVGRVDLGTLAWIKDSYNNWLSNAGSILAKSQLNCLCSKYPVVANPEDVDYGCKISGNLNRVVIHDKDTLSMTESELKTYISGVMFYYELATPVETDISQYIDNNTIEVEENGTLVSNNTYEQKVPSEITYLVEVSNG